MSEKSTITITIEDDVVSFASELSVIEVNFWLDHIKFLITSGQVQSTATPIE